MVLGLNDFIFLLSYIAGVGVNQASRPCITCVRPGCKRYTVGGIQGGDFEIKIYKINYFLCFISCRRRQRYSV